MQNTLSLVKDVRGCMTRFDPLTPEIVADQTEDGLTYDELKEVLDECGMDIGNVVFDGSRAFQNAFYADFEQGHYCWIPFQKKGLKDVIRTMDQQFHSESFGIIVSIESGGVTQSRAAPLSTFLRMILYFSIEF